MATVPPTREQRGERQDVDVENVAWLLEWPAQIARLLPDVQDRFRGQWETWNADADALNAHVRGAIDRVLRLGDALHSFLGNGTGGVRAIFAGSRDADEKIMNELDLPHVFAAGMPLVVTEIAMKLVTAALLAVLGFLLAYETWGSESGYYTLLGGWLAGMALAAALTLIARHLARGRTTRSQRVLVFTTCAGIGSAALVAMLTREGNIEWPVSALAGAVFGGLCWLVFTLREELDDWYVSSLVRRVLPPDAADALLTLALVDVVARVGHRDSERACESLELTGPFQVELRAGVQPESVEIKALEFAARLADRAAPRSEADAALVRRRDRDRATRVEAFLLAQRTALLDDRPGERARAVEQLTRAAVAYTLKRWEVIAEMQPEIPERRRHIRVSPVPVLLLAGAAVILAVDWKLGSPTVTAAPLIIAALVQLNVLNDRGKEASVALVEALKRS